jgi:hypothetical protein
MMSTNQIYFGKSPPVIYSCKVRDKVCNMRHSLHHFETYFDVRAVRAFGRFHRPRIYLKLLGGCFAIFTPAAKNFQKYNNTKIDGYTSRMKDGAAPPVFTCFADFPLDIRVCIWKEVAFFPRGVDLWAQGLVTIASSSGQPHGFTLFRYITTQPPPTILHVNNES